MQKVTYSPALIQDWFNSQKENVQGINVDFSKEEISLYMPGGLYGNPDINVGSYPRTDEGLGNLLTQLKASGMNVPEFDTFVVPVIEQPAIEEPAPAEQQAPVEEVSSKWKYLKWGGGIAIGALAVYLAVKVLGPETVAEATGKLLS